MMRRLDGLARGLGLDEAATRQIVEKVYADMPVHTDEERLMEARTRMIVASAYHGLAGLGAVPHGRGQYATWPELQDAEALLVGPQQRSSAGSRIGMPVGNGSRSKSRLDGLPLPIVPVPFYLPAGSVRSGRMARRGVFVRSEEVAFLEEARRWRQQCIQVLTRATPQGPLYKATEKVIEAIDDVAEPVTGDRRTF